MNIFDIGRICVKLAGRDAGKKCVIVESLDSQFVLIDGETRRRKVNIKHLEPLDEVLELKRGASHEQVQADFEKRGWVVWDTKPKQPGARPRLKRKAGVKDIAKVQEKKVSKAKAKKNEALEKNEATLVTEKPKKVRVKKEE